MRYRCPVPHGIDLQGSSAIFGRSLLEVLVPFALMLSLGLYSLSVARDRKSNLCKMTWCRPMYLPLAVPRHRGARGGGAKADPPGYGYRLLRYLDDAQPQRERANPRKPQGMPVIFVPGHLGDYMQVRLSRGSS